MQTVSSRINGPWGKPGAAVLDERFVERDVLSHLSDRAAAHPYRMAIEDASVRLVYGDLLDAVTNLAKGIVATTKPGAAVAILLPNNTLYPVAALACLAAGRPYVALDAEHPVERNAVILADSGAVAVIHQSFGLGKDVPRPLGVRVLDIGLAFAEAGTHPWPDAALPAIDVDAPAIVLHTSGSTGIPKGIVNSQRALLSRVVQQADSIASGPGDVSMPLSSLCTIAGTREFLTAVLTGATLRMCDTRIRSLGSTRRLIRDRKVTLVYAVPALFRELIQGAEPGDLASLRVVRLGGDRILWDDVDRFEATLPNCSLQVGYSSTETTGTQWFVPRGAKRSGATVPVGYMPPGLAFRIVDAAGNAAAEGTVGELVISGRDVALGNWLGGAVVPGSILPDGQGGRIFATGDLVQIDGDGLFDHIGRKDRQVQVNGRRVEPAELESALRRHGRVRDAAVTAWRSKGNAALVAFVSGDDADGRLAEVLRAMVRESLPGPLRPVRIHVLKRIPRLSGHKVDGTALAAIDEAAMLRLVPETAGAGSGAGSVHATVARIWGEVLGHEFDPEAGWDEAGGDSLGAMRLLNEIERAFGCTLDPAVFRLDMRPGEFATTVERALSGRERKPDPHGRPTVFLCPGVVGDGPALALFRTEAERHVALVPLRYIDWQAMGEGGVGSVADDVLEQIVRFAPTGDIRLAGYSFGGPVAAEVAYRLAALGRHVVFLGILDSCIVPVRPRRGAGILGTAARWRGGMDTPFRMMIRPIARLLAGRGQLSALTRLAGALPPGLRFSVDLEAMDVARARAYWRWVARADKPKLACPVTLFRSQEARPGAPRDLGWSALADTVAIVDVQGSHLGMMQPPYREAVAISFARETMGMANGSEPLGA